MAQAVRRRSLSPLALLNSDGKAHPKENSLALATIVLGLVAALTNFWPGLHMISSWTGLVGVLVGGAGLMLSVTTAERFLLVIGLGAAGVGFFLGVAHGGLWGGL
ncbi:hypothetical protein [Streptomyces xiaopingdaonensis]|uniref:hypothetical protein n=1 Tax=Streptomyces xiaopingdaonensis TaxID=1565415 RepID=UPI0002F050EF|nr:hypothetical protein [Streptomyces xiaopingdaonensis]